MSTFEERELDSSVEEDWRSFARHLADHMGSVDGFRDFSLTPLFTPSESPRLALECRLTPAGTIRCSNTRSGDVGEQWPHDPATGLHVLEMPAAWADYVAAIAVEEVRRAWGVPHPSFLTGFGREPTSSYVVTGAAQASALDDEDDLMDAVRRTLESTAGSDIEASPDGSFALTAGSTTMYVYAADLSEVRIHAPIVERVSGRTRAAELLVDLNRRHPRLKFLLVDDRIHVTASVDVSPFVPNHLTNAVERVAEFVARADDAFARHLGGAPVGCKGEASPPTSDRAENEDVPPPLMALLELDAADSADVDDVVSVCGADRSKIAEYAVFCSEQARAWRLCAREAEEHGDRTAQAECEGEAVPWDRIVATLRLALRTVAFYDNA